MLVVVSVHGLQLPSEVSLLSAIHSVVVILLQLKRKLSLLR